MLICFQPTDSWVSWTPTTVTQPRCEHQWSETSVSRGRVYNTVSIQQNINASLECRRAHLYFLASIRRHTNAEKNETVISVYRLIECRFRCCCFSSLIAAIWSLKMQITIQIELTRLPTCLVHTVQILQISKKYKRPSAQSRSHGFLPFLSLTTKPQRLSKTFSNALSISKISKTAEVTHFCWTPLYFLISLTFHRTPQWT